MDFQSRRLLGFETFEQLANREQTCLDIDLRVYRI